MESPGRQTSLSPKMKALMPFSGVTPETSKELIDSAEPSVILR